MLIFIFVIYGGEIALQLARAAKNSAFGERHVGRWIWRAGAGEIPQTLPNLEKGLTLIFL